MDSVPDLSQIVTFWVNRIFFLQTASAVSSYYLMSVMEDSLDKCIILTDIWEGLCESMDV